MSTADDHDEVRTGPPASEDNEARELVAFPTTPRQSVDIVPAPRWRDWINVMDERWANRCLPLLVANEAGWALLNPVPFQATWGGSPEPSSITIEFEEELAPPHPVATHFGYGILTWSVPYLFRTPPGWNLLARGPANWPKDGVTPLEGLVETDWSVATFTMNWQLTRPGLTVAFERDEPFCMIVPQRRGDLESFRPTIKELSTDPATHAQAEEWAKARDQLQVRKFLSNFSGEFEPYRNAWEQNYFRGTRPDGSQAPEHQTRLGLEKFERD
jgi:Family of unknown function (DUF6065)